jgi:hypothetical protein
LDEDIKGIIKTELKESKNFRHFSSSYFEILMLMFTLAQLESEEGR